MVVTNRYQTQAPAIASYNYTDIEDGTGVIRYYAGAMRDNSGITYRLSNETFNCYHSNSGTDPTYVTGRWTFAGTTSTTFAKITDVTFNTSPFIISKFAKGKVIIQIPISAGNVETTGTTTTFYAVVTYYKYDGSATSIGTTTSAEIVQSYGASFGWITMETTLTDTVFNVGSYLQAQIQIYAKTSSASYAAGILLSHDPKNNPTVAMGAYMGARTTEDTILTLDVPYKILN